MSLNYIGSKHSLLPFIDNSIKQTIGPGQNLRTFADLFAGRGAVGEYFKEQGYNVIANDTQYYSYVINRHRLGDGARLEFKGLFGQIPGLKTQELQGRQQVICDYLNHLKGQPGFIYKHYSPGGSGGQRMYFTDKNSRLCDAIRKRIGAWRQAAIITEAEFNCLLCSLIESIDRHANTASIYGAFLKEFKKTARQDFRLKPARTTKSSDQMTLLPNQASKTRQTAPAQVYRQDANSLVRKLDVDIAYIDPPYNHRQYSANYHLLETIALYDNPTISGKTGLRDNGFKSKYCQKRLAIKAFSDLINNLKAKYIFLSYNNEGVMSFEEIKTVMAKKGSYGFYDKTYGRYKADSQRLNRFAETKEYLHYIKT